MPDKVDIAKGIFEQIQPQLTALALQPSLIKKVLKEGWEQVRQIDDQINRSIGVVGLQNSQLAIDGFDLFVDKMKSTANSLSSESREQFEPVIDIFRVAVKYLRMRLWYQSHRIFVLAGMGIFSAVVALATVRTLRS